MAAVPATDLVVVPEAIDLETATAVALQGMTAHYLLESVYKPAPGETERTVGQLVSDATHDISALVQSEIQLAKAEVTKGLSFGGKGAGLLGGAAFVGLLGLIFLILMLFYGLMALGLPAWASALIIALLSLIRPMVSRMRAPS